MTESGTTATSATLDITGEHTYSTHTTYDVGIDVVGGASATLSGTASVHDAIATCSGCSGGESCSTGATVSNQMSTGVSGTSTTNGQIFVDVGLDTLSCGDRFDHAPEVSTVTESDFSSASGELITLTIDKEHVESL